MNLKKKDVEHIANLARLELTSEEIKKLTSELSDILNYIDQLKEVDTTDTEPTAQVTGLLNVLREDETEDWNEQEKKEALSQAPAVENNQIKVKRVLE